MNFNDFLETDFNKLIKQKVEENNQSSIQDAKKQLKSIINELLINVDSLMIDLDFQQRQLFNQKLGIIINNYKDLKLGLITKVDDSVSIYYSLNNYYLDEPASPSRKAKLILHSFCLKQIIDEFKLKYDNSNKNNNKKPLKFEKYTLEDFVIDFKNHQILNENFKNYNPKYVFEQISCLIIPQRILDKNQFREFYQRAFMLDNKIDKIKLHKNKTIGRLCQVMFDFYFNSNYNQDILNKARKEHYKNLVKDNIMDVNDKTVNNNFRRVTNKKV